MIDYLRTILRPVCNTPFHPQWLVRGGTPDLINQLTLVEKDSTVLDIGCFDKWAKTKLPSSVEYIGLDYPGTANEWYNTIPDVYADAHVLPLESSSADVVLLLDVLEHLTDPHIALLEIKRVLRDGGQLIMNTPFLYPLHDEPRDFVRFSEHWYREFLGKYELRLESCAAQGHPVETAALLSNIAWSKTILNWINERNPACVLIVLYPVLMLLNNMIAKIVSNISVKDTFMPYSYRVVCSKVGDK